MQTYDDILKLHEQIDECVYERDELREKTLPLQVQDNRLRALFKEENWKLREFDEWIARQDPDWKPPPRLPHSRKKRNKRLREIAREEAAQRRARAAEESTSDHLDGMTATTDLPKGSGESHSRRATVTLSEGVYNTLMNHPLESGIADTPILAALESPTLSSSKDTRSNASTV